MDIQPRFSTYIVSAITGYWLAFIASAVVVAIIESEMTLFLIPIFFFSLFFAIGVTIFASLLGYPAFKILFKKLRVSNFPKLLISGACSVLVSVLFFVLAFNYLMGGAASIYNVLQTSAGFLTFGMVVVPFSALVYWLIER